MGLQWKNWHCLYSACFNSKYINVCFAAALNSVLTTKGQTHVCYTPDFTLSSWKGTLTDECGSAINIGTVVPNRKHQERSRSALFCFSEIHVLLQQKCTFLWVEFGVWMHWHLFILVGCTLGHISVTLVAHMSCRDYEFESWSIITYTRWYWFLYGNLIMNPQHWCLPCTCSYVYHTCAGNHEKNAAAENEDPVTHTVHPGCSSPASAAVWNVYVHLPLAHLLCLPCVQWCLGVVPDHVLWKKTVSNKGKVIYIRKTTLKPPVYHFRQEGAVQWQPFW